MGWAMGTIDTSRVPREGRYEYCELFLGGSGRTTEQIAEMVRSGWELIDIQVPHYGSLTIVGRFRRVDMPPAAVDSER